MKTVKLLLILFVLLVSLTLLLILSTAAEEPMGTYGNLFWQLADSGTLFISGEGRMPIIDDEGIYPWLSLSDRITAIVIDDGIISISQDAFSGCYAVTTVTIGADVSYVGLNAFSGCNTLHTVWVNSPSVTLALSEENACGDLILHATELYVTNASGLRPIYFLQRFPCLSEYVTPDVAYSLYHSSHDLAEFTSVSGAAVTHELRCTHGCGYAEIIEHTEKDSTPFYLIVGGMTMVTALASFAFNHYLTRRKKKTV